MRPRPSPRIVLAIASLDGAVAFIDATIVNIAFPDRPPALGETLARVLQLGSENTAEAARRYADLVIKPRAEGVGLLEFGQLDTAREAGRVAAREAVERAPAFLMARTATT